MVLHGFLMSKSTPHDNRPTTETGDTIVYLYGRDGWPVGPSDATYINAAVEARHRRDLEAALERLRDGDLTAVSEATRLLWLLDRVPRELVEASQELVIRAMAEDEKRARRDYRIAVTRWEALKELRERRHELARAGDDRGTSWPKARAAASKALRGTEARGSAGTIKYSYELIEAAGDATFESYQQERRRREEEKRRRRERD